MIQIEALLKNFRMEWIEAIRNKRYDEDFIVAWPGFRSNLMNHITALIAHERLHHGQLISYFTMSGFDLPTKFKFHWSL